MRLISATSIDAAPEPWLGRLRVEYSEEDQPPRASEPGEARYVPPSLIPRPRLPADLDSPPVKLARDIDPRQQTTRRVMVLRRFWYRHRKRTPLALLLVGAVGATAAAVVLVRPVSTIRLLPEPQPRGSGLGRGLAEHVRVPVRTRPANPSAVPTPPPRATATATAAAPAHSAPPVRKTDAVRSAKPRARRVWLE